MRLPPPIGPMPRSRAIWPPPDLAAEAAAPGAPGADGQQRRRTSNRDGAYHRADDTKTGARLNAVPDRLLLLLPKTSYTGDAFLEACDQEGVEVLVATDRCPTVGRMFEFPENTFEIDFYEPAKAVQTIVAAARERPVTGVIPASGEATALVAAMAAERLGLPYNSVAAAEAARNKRRMRELLSAAGVASPRFFAFDMDADPATVAARVTAELGWPCVIKPLLLSGSRGVMRADHPAGLAAAAARLRGLLAIPELLEMDAVAARQVLVEEFVPGAEVALEGLLDGGELRTLAIFDKPDPLDGPFFEETIYVTPSRTHGRTQEAVRSTTAAAARAMGLSHGPVHAELRLSPSGPVVIEVAARSIGGLCSRILRFGTGRSLEELLVRHAVGRDVTGLAREADAAGVMMIPIPAAGLLKTIDGEETARALPGIDDVVISAKVGDELVPLPEGASYLGFIFAHGASAQDVESTLRAAHRALRFAITPMLPVR